MTTTATQAAELAARCWSCGHEFEIPEHALEDRGQTRGLGRHKPGEKRWLLGRRVIAARAFCPVCSEDVVLSLDHTPVPRFETHETMCRECAEPHEVPVGGHVHCERCGSFVAPPDHGGPGLIEATRNAGAHILDELNFRGLAGLHDHWSRLACLREAYLTPEDSREIVWGGSHREHLRARLVWAVLHALWHSGDEEIPEALLPARVSMAEGLVALEAFADLTIRQMIDDQDESGEPRVPGGEPITVEQAEALLSLSEDERWERGDRADWFYGALYAWLAGL